jgi:hypothetical protein
LRKYFDKLAVAIDEEVGEQENLLIHNNNNNIHSFLWRGSR